MHWLNGILMDTIQGWSLAPGETRTAVWLGPMFRSQANGWRCFLPSRKSAFSCQPERQDGLCARLLQRCLVLALGFFHLLISLNHNSSFKVKLYCFSQQQRELSRCKLKTVLLFFRPVRTTAIQEMQTPRSSGTIELNGRI